MENRKATLNAKVGGIALVFGAIALHVVNQFDFSLQPVRLMIVGILVLGAWAFSDEMGLRKPLNRVALIAFIFSMVALAVTIMEPSAGDDATGVAAATNTQQYILIYSFTLLIAILVWSAAFLHREKDLKVIGAMGALASVVPLLILIAGHISIGAGAYFGVQTLLQPTGELAVLSSNPVRAIEALFIVFSIATAVLLWKGRMTASQV